MVMYPVRYTGCHTISERKMPMFSVSGRFRAVQALSLLLASLMLLCPLLSCGSPAETGTTTTATNSNNGTSTSSTDDSEETRIGLPDDSNAVTNSSTENSSELETVPATEETIEKETVEEAYVPDIPEANYGEEFRIADVGYEKEWLIVEEEDVRSGNVMDEAVFERCARIQDQLGVECVFVDAGSWVEYASAVQRAVNVGDDAYHLVITHVYEGVTSLATKNCLYDFADLPSVNLEAPYWNLNLMDMIKMEDQYLLGYNDACLADTNCIIFNKDLMKKYNMEAPYSKVTDMTWTLDVLLSMASQVSQDNGDGVWDENDTYGMSGWGWVQLISFVTASDIKMLDKDADTGKYYIAYEDKTERVLSLIDKIYDMYNADWSYMWKSNATVTLKFDTGRTLFQLYATRQLSSLASEGVFFGVLPYPMFDEAQGNYQHLSWNGLMCIPVVIKNQKMVSDVMELMAYYSEPVKEAYFETLLGTIIADAPEDSAMLDIIWDTIVSDVGLICCNQMDNLVYMLPKMCENQNKDFASYIKRNKKSAEKLLSKVFK